MIIIDNSIVSFAFNIDNGVLVKDFHSNMVNDEEFLYLCKFLEDAFSQNDLREFNREKFKLSTILKTL